MSDNSQKDWVYRSSSKKLLWAILIAICALSLIGESFVHLHPHFKAEELPYFYAILGLGSPIVMIIIAKLLGFFIKTRPDYYDDDTR